jgi:hypothetical protein
MILLIAFFNGISNPNATGTSAEKLAFCLQTLQERAEKNSVFPDSETRKMVLITDPMAKFKSKKRVAERDPKQKAPS